MKIAREIISAVVLSLRERGLRDTGRILWSTLRDHEFDREYQTESSARVDVADLGPAGKRATFYQGSRAKPLRRLFGELNLDPDEGFVDLGSGKGRALILAAEQGARFVKGVELSGELHRVAGHNIERVRRRFPLTFFELLHLDVADYEIAAGDVNFYMYDPFDRGMVLDFLRKLEGAIGAAPFERTFRFIYHHNFMDLGGELAAMKIARFQRTYIFSGNRFFVMSNQALQGMGGPGTA